MINIKQTMSTKINLLGKQIELMGLAYQPDIKMLKDFKPTLGNLDMVTDKKIKDSLCQGGIC